MSRAIKIRNPRNGKSDYTINLPNIVEMQAQADRLRAGQASWVELGLEGRKTAMLQLCDAIDRHYDEIRDALCEDTGRYEWSVAEIEGVKGITQMHVATVDDALAAISGQSGDASLSFHQQYVPHQLVGIISPWNYPLILSMIDTITALLAGSAVLVKPSEVTPRFIKPYLTAIAEVPYLRDVLGYVEGDGEIGAATIDLTDMVVFTGSVPTGRKVQERAASQFKTAFLELGGNDPAVVLDSANAATAAEIIVRGAMENAGQLCCSIERVYAGPAIYDALVKEVVAQTEAVEMNIADIKTGEVGPIIFDRQAQIIQAQLDDAISKGAEIVTGGKILETNGGLWCEPTVLVGVTQDMKIMQDETFGPIVPIAAFANADEAVSLANDTTFGLSATVIGEEEAAVAIGERINAGGIWINDFDTMGGVGDKAEKTAFGFSGLGGTRYGPGGFFRFLRKKAVVVRRQVKSAA
jgi:succinate-semialdehyde dehydrogenase / glutarate-semialdehyde dehydrogenase